MGLNSEMMNVLEGAGPVRRYEDDVTNMNENVPKLKIYFRSPSSAVKLFYTVLLKNQSLSLSLT